MWHNMEARLPLVRMKFPVGDEHRFTVIDKIDGAVAWNTVEGHLPDTDFPKEMYPVKCRKGDHAGEGKNQIVKFPELE